MRVVGVGCGPGMLTEAAREAISSATVVYGSKRAIELVADRLSPAATVTVITDYRRLGELSGEVVVLSTGDPMLAGLGFLGGEVIPGISSLQVACSRLHIPLAKIAVVDAHATDPEAALGQMREEIGRGKVVFILSMPGLDPRKIAEKAGEALKLIRIALCEELGYPGERIVIGTPSEPPGPSSLLHSYVVGEF